MDLLAVSAFSVLVERYRQSLAHPERIVDGRYSFSAIWRETNDLTGDEIPFGEMQRSLDRLVDAGLVEREGAFLYCFCAPRKSAAA